MYCRNCGTQFSQGAYICTACGVPAGKGNNHCPACGSSTDPQAVMCVKCGVGFVPLESVVPPGVEQKSRMVGAILAFFLGTVGVHNFYLGYTNKAVAQLLITVLSCGAGVAVTQIWAIVEMVMLLTGSISTDGNGYPLKSDI